jgi:hypothetical protein
MMCATTVGRLLDGLHDVLLPLLEELLGSALDREGFLGNVASPAHF